MRCTTELTARFALAITALPAPTFAENCDAPAGSIEYWEAFERDDARADTDLLDALDFDTVSFDSVDEELSLELFAQDAAEDREYDNGLCECFSCGRSDDFDDGLLTRIAGRDYCARCKPSPLETVILLELHQKRFERARNARCARANKFRAALETLKVSHPDMNWDRYQHDARAYAY